MANPTSNQRLAGLSKYARDWLNDLRRQSGGYPAEVLRHINILEEDVLRSERISDHLGEENSRLRAALEHYGRHEHPNCYDLTLKEDGSFGPRNGCLCGFDAAKGEGSPVETFGKEAWRVSLPVITVQMLADYGQEGFFEKTDKPVKGVAGVDWSQASVDFACMLQGIRQERGPLEPTPHQPPKPIATVINNNQPGWTNIIETAPNVTLPVGTKLYAESALLEVGCRVADEIWQQQSSPEPSAPRESDWMCIHCGRDNDPAETHCGHCEWSRRHTIAGVLHERACGGHPCTCGAVKPEKATGEQP